METKEFSAEAAVSLVHHRLLCGFDQVQELGEFFVGHPVWTHEFAHKPTVERMRNAVLAQHPELSNWDDSECDETNWERYATDARNRFGDKLTFTKGDGGRTMSPMDTVKLVAPHAEVIGVELP